MSSRTGRSFGLSRRRTKINGQRCIRRNWSSRRSFAFRRTKTGLYVELHHGSCMSGADLYRRSDSKAAGPNDVGPFQPIEPSLDDGAWAGSAQTTVVFEKFRGRRTLFHGSLRRVERRLGPVTAHHPWRRRATQNTWAIVSIIIRAPAGSN